MDDLDFSAPTPPKKAEAAAISNVQSTSQSPLYDPKLALAFFRSAGTVETKPGGKPIFTENEKSGGLFSKSARMYLLLEGEVGLLIKNKFFGVVKQGDVFGELAVIAGLPRSATAMAKTDCKVLSLDEKQFHVALSKAPGFALMLMSIMVNRLRQSLAKLSAAGAAKSLPAAERSAVLDKKMLAELEAALDGQSPASYEEGKIIVSAGALGAFMFVVTSGTVAITAGDTLIERVGPGAIFGEMALVDRSARAATAVAETDCTLLSIGRNDFLSLVQAKPAFGASLLKSIAERMQHLAMQVAKLQ